MGLRITGILLVVGGVACGAAAIFVPGGRLGLIITGAVLVPVGVFMFFLGGSVSEMMKDLPKPQSMSSAMQQAQHKMESQVYLLKLKERASHLRSFGLDATAHVLSATPTETVVSGDTLYNYKLRIEIEGRPPYEVDHQQLTPNLMLDRVRAPGASFRAKVDQQQPNELILEWV